MASPYELSASGSRYKTAFNWYLAFISLVLLRYGIRYAQSLDSFSLADWLINYHGGFVRRGLVGEFILRVAHLLHFPPSWTVLLAQIAAYGLTFFIFRKLLLESSWRPWIIALALSPATISFPVFNLAGSFRKEILIFAALAGLIYLLLYSRPKDFVICVYLAVALPALVLSHESAFFYCGYFLCALFLAFGDWRRCLWIFAPAGLLATVALLLAVHFPGNLSVAEAVCSGAGYTWQERFHGPCGGSIYALTFSSQWAHEDLVGFIRRCPYYWAYPVLAGLSFLPIVAGFFHLRSFRSTTTSLRTLAATILICGALSTVLFYYALDWGRFIYMHVMCAAMLILTIEVLKQRSAEEAEATSTVRFERKNVPIWIGILLYATCWTLVYCPAPGYLPPPLGVAKVFFVDPATANQPPTFLASKWRAARAAITKTIQGNRP